MKPIATLIATALALGAAVSPAAETAAPAAPVAAAAEQPKPWKYNVLHLSREEVDAALAKPGEVLVLDVRRPDELIKYGSFPVFLSIQAKDVEKSLAWLPRDRAILTVSNHAQRAGAIGDLLARNGFKIAGATGSEDYEQAGGKAVAHITPPPPRTAAAGTAAVASASAN